MSIDLSLKAQSIAGTLYGYQFPQSLQDLTLVFPTTRPAAPWKLNDSDSRVQLHDSLAKFNQLCGEWHEGHMRETKGRRNILPAFEIDPSATPRKWSMDFVPGLESEMHLYSYGEGGTENHTNDSIRFKRYANIGDTFDLHQMDHDTGLTRDFVIHWTRDATSIRLLMRGAASLFASALPAHFNWEDKTASSGIQCARDIYDRIAPELGLGASMAIPFEESNRRDIIDSRAAAVSLVVADRDRWLPPLRVSAHNCYSSGDKKNFPWIITLSLEWIGSSTPTLSQLW